jgi:hypothetical protein
VWLEEIFVMTAVKNNTPKRTINDRMLRALKPAGPGQRSEVRDTVVPGFRVRVTDKGTKDACNDNCYDFGFRGMTE